jgi:hypothetical protein|tara:strand:- start:1866 stop:2006 length:141 start_codon:yes stop_codon:yes gene_type:complete
MMASPSEVKIIPEIKAPVVKPKEIISNNRVVPKIKSPEIVPPKLKS